MLTWTQTDTGTLAADSGDGERDYLIMPPDTAALEWFSLVIHVGDGEDYAFTGSLAEAKARAEELEAELSSVA